MFITLTVTPLVTINLVKVFVTRDLENNTLVVRDILSGSTETLSLDQIVDVDPIVGVKAPKVNRPSRLRPRKVS